MIMSDDQNIDDIEGLQEQIDFKRKRLRLLQRQGAIYGISTPPEITIQIEDLTREIGVLQRRLKALADGQPSQAGGSRDTAVSGQGGNTPTIVVHGSYIAGNVDTGSGNFIGRDLSVAGDQVGGDKAGGDRITTGNISGSTGIALGRDARALVTQTAVDTLFETISQAIAVRPEDPDIDKIEITENVEAIRREITNGVGPNAKKIARWLKNMADIARDIFRLTVDGLADPQLNLPPEVRETIAQARQLLNQS
jgi:hypothetical protein